MSLKKIGSYVLLLSLIPIIGFAQTICPQTDAACWENFFQTSDPKNIANLFAHPDPTIRSRVARMMGLVSHKMPVTQRMELLLPLLSDPDATVRVNAVFTLGKTIAFVSDFEIKQLFSALLKACGDPDMYVRSSAAYALGSGKDRMGELLIQALQDTQKYSKEQREAILAALRTTKSPKALSEIARMLKQPQIGKEQTLALLETIESSPAPYPAEMLESLEDLFVNSRDSDILRHTANALIKAGKPSVALFVKHLGSREEALARRSAWSLAQMGDTARPQIISAFQSPNRYLRARAALTVGFGRWPDAVTLLKSLIDDPDPEVRWFAAYALGLLKSKSAIFPLKTALTDSSPRVRVSAVAALGKISDPHLLLDLLPLLADPSSEVISATRLTLQTLATPETIPAITPYLTHVNPETRAATATLLGEIALSSHIPDLQPLLTDTTLVHDKAVSVYAQEAISRIWERSSKK